MKKIVLASTSPYRKQLFSRLLLPFECRAPQIDETPQVGEAAESLVLRLSQQKARAVAQANEWVIGSDQVALLDGQLLGKPLSHERAIRQLEASSGRKVQFITGLCLIQNLQLHAVAADWVEVQFRQLSRAEIERYLQRESVLDCAGSFKCEGLGISLFESISSQDPNSLMGLPLIRLCQWLRATGIDVP